MGKSSHGSLGLELFPSCASVSTSSTQGICYKKAQMCRVT